MKLPWLRLYTEFSTDPDIQSLAFEDQRHYVMALCLKRAGVLDKPYPTAERRAAVIARALGLDTVSAAEACRRLVEAGLVLEDWQPAGWDKRQFDSDLSTPRVHRWRVKRFRNGGETPPDTDTDTEEALRARAREKPHPPASVIPLEPMSEETRASLEELKAEMTRKAKARRRDPNPTPAESEASG